MARPEPAFRAVIFDLDGVLADSEPDYLAGGNAVLARYGKHLKEEESRALIGKSVSITWLAIKEGLGLEEELETLLAYYDEAMVRLLSRPREPIPGVRWLLGELRRRAVPIGIATSAWRSWAEALLPAIGLDSAFDAVVYRQMAEKPKPAPDLYLKAAELLKAPPAACIGIEDTPTGLAAVKAAGMYAVQVRAASTAFPPIDGADLVIDNLEQFPLGLVEAN